MIHSDIAELLTLKRIAARDQALVNDFSIDDNFAIRRARIKSLLREIFQRDACLPWIAQITSNLLKDEELVELIAAFDLLALFCGCLSQLCGSGEDSYMTQFRIQLPVRGCRWAYQYFRL